MATPPPPLVAVFLTLLLLISATSSDSAAISVPFNSSVLSLPFNSSALLLPPPRDSSRRPRTFLMEVVRALAAKERWDPESVVRLAGFDGRGARAGVAQRYEFHARVGKRALILKFYDEAISWTKAEGAVVESGSDLIVGDGVDGLRPAIRALELVGPLELRVGVGGGDNNRISLHLPALNITHSGLRQIFVDSGIRIKIEGAEGISIAHPYDIELSLNGSLAAHSRVNHNKFQYLGYSSCAPLLSVHIVGTASVLPFRATSNIEAAFKAPDVVELLLTKCYSTGHVKQMSSCSFCSVSSRLSLLDKLLRGLLGSIVFQKTSIRFVKVQVMSATLIKFRLQLERDITQKIRSSEKASEWKQKPKVEQIWLETMARVEGERRLKPLSVKKLKRPYIVSDSISMSSLLLNISFTKLPPFVVPPEALTLDVKW
ncbi:hypothetical protein Cni_G24198 [Canna indica]|uniref:Uncharacterized protein n=1 Tax=Canna indica TaxID=4628 RepID=A0AAQ3KUJ4_9LILI|nr:hypothetical protein Cni_G24198 [Canna indica]